MTAAADRQRLHRERERGGKIILAIEADAAELIELLIEARLLDPRQDHFSRDMLAAAVERFLHLARHT